MAVTRLGTLGWSFKEWEGVFYPIDNTDKLTYYSRIFKTVEIDSTFYAYPRKAMIQACARVTPDGFVFSARVPKLITHDKKLDIQKGVGEDLMRFIHDLRPLEDAKKLGPLIFQLPPSFRYEDGLRKLIDFIGALPADLKFALEFQNKSWRRPETWDLLKQCKIASVIVDGPLVPPYMAVTADFAVIEWLGRGKKLWADYNYNDMEVDEWLPKVKEIEGRVKEVYGYFGNHLQGNAIENCLRTIDALGFASDEQKDIRARAARAIQLRAMRYPRPKTALSG